MINLFAPVQRDFFMLKTLNMKQNEMTFDDLSDYMRSILNGMGIDQLTDAQRMIIPAIRSGKDVLIKAAAASGKTFAYMIPLFELLEPQGKGKHFPCILILVPTRELALQSAKAARSLLAKKEGIRTSVLAGGEDMNAQVRSFSKGADIVIATPSRLKDHLRRHTFKTQMLKHLVIDEADLMMNMGFEDDVTEVSNALEGVQRMMLSATFSNEMKQLAVNLMHEPEEIEVPEETVHEQKIHVRAVFVNENQKLDQLASLIRKSEYPPVIFCNKRVSADFVSRQMNQRGFHTSSIHSDMDMKVRRKIMDDFREMKISALCASDVLARGIDIPFVSCVILYDYPENEETLIHRIARSSRKTQLSEAILLLTPKEKYRIKQAEKILNTKISR